MKRQPGIGDLLDQEEFWISREDDGLREVKITDMKLNHIINLRRWLRSQARRLHNSEVMALYSMSSMVTGEMASEDLERSIDAAEQESPLEWLADKPLFRALGQEIHRRQGAKADPGLRRHLSANERVELAHRLRPVDNTIQDVVRSLSPIEGMSHMSVAQWNAQVDSLIASLRELRRA
jgi:hypothetical protein